MDPINFTPNRPSPSENIMRAVQTGLGLQQMSANKLAMESAQTDLDYKTQLNADLLSLGDNPSPSAISSLAAKYPKLAEKFKIAHDLKSEEQKQSVIDSASKVYAATLSGRPDLAEQHLMESAEAAKNSGDEKEAKVLNDLAEMVKLSPKQAQTIAGVLLSSAMGDKFVETFTGLENSRRAQEMQSSKVSEADSKAYKAAMESKYAESNAAIDLEKKGWDIWKLQQDVDISRENSRIAAMNAASAKETNNLKRQELDEKVKKAKQKRDDLVMQKAAILEQASSTIDNSLSTIDRILKSPGLADVTGAVEGKPYYPNVAAGVTQTLNPFTSSADERANVIADIETLQSQLFLSQLKSLRESAPTGSSGLGNLTEKEGDRLINSLQSLRRDQGEKKFKESMVEIQRLLLKARGSMFDKYGVPQSVPDRPEVQVTPEVPKTDIPLPNTSGFKVIGVK